MHFRKNMILNIKKKAILAAAFALSMGMLTGCGKTDLGEFTSKGYTAISSQSYVEALGYFEQALLSDEDTELVYRGRGLAFMGASEYEKALSAFKNALSNADMFPGDLEYDINHYMAVCYYKLGSYNEAISVYDAIVNLRPKDAEAYFQRGKMKLYINDLEGATADFDTAVGFNKKDYGVYLDVYETMNNCGYGDAANQYLDVLLSADVDDISAYNKGRMCYYQGDYKRSLTYLESARQTDDRNNPELITLLGDCYKKDGNYEFAAVIYSSYLDAVKDPAIYNQLGLCYIEQKNYSAALNAFQQGIEVQENNTCMQTLKHNEIVCYEYLQDYDTAKEKLSEFMTTYSSDPELEKELAFLTTR